MCSIVSLKSHQSMPIISFQLTQYILPTGFSKSATGTYTFISKTWESSMALWKLYSAIKNRSNYGLSM